MGARLLAIYLLLWGVGLVIDPRLLEYKAAGFIGLALIGGAWMFIEHDTRIIPDFGDLELNHVFKNASPVAILVFLIGLAAIILAVLYWFYPFA